jgi:hypothetical protein
MGQQRMLTPPDPSITFVGGPCCPTLNLVYAFRIMITFYTMLISLFCTLKDFVDIYNCMNKTHRFIRFVTFNIKIGIFHGKKLKVIIPCSTGIRQIFHL